MLDRVFKAAEHEVIKPAAPDIPGGDHLAAGEAGRRCGFDDRHPLVVGREADAQVQREDRLLDGDESECLERESTHSTTVRYSAACSMMRAASTAAAWSRRRRSRLIP